MPRFDFTPCDFSPTYDAESAIANLPILHPGLAGSLLFFAARHSPPKLFVAQLVASAAKGRYAIRISVVVVVMVERHSTDGSATHKAILGAIKDS